MHSTADAITENLKSIHQREAKSRKSFEVSRVGDRKTCGRDVVTLKIASRQIFLARDGDLGISQSPDLFIYSHHNSHREKKEVIFEP